MKNQELRYIDLLRLREETFKYFTEEESLKAVRKRGGNLAYVKHQTPEICLEAVRQNGWALRYVINQTEEICLEAHKQDPTSIEFIRIDIKDEKLRKTREDWFKYFTLEESLKAVRENGYALRYVHNQTEEICLEAYKQEPGSIKYIRDSLEDYRKRRLNLISATF